MMMYQLPRRQRNQTRQLRNDKSKEKIEARVGTSEAGVRPQHLSWELTVVIVVVDEPLNDKHCRKWIAPQLGNDMLLNGVTRRRRAVGKTLVTY